MPTPGKKRSREAAGAINFGAGHSELVQTHVMKRAKTLLKERAQAEAISEAAYLRRLIYRDLGIMPEDKPHG